MIFQILKKDMMKRKGVNIILFLFITLATVFLSSSVNNILIVNSAVDYYMEYAHVPDVNLILNSDKEREDIDQWLEQLKNQKEITAYAFDTLQTVADKSLKIDKNANTIDSKGASLYIGTMDANYNKVYDQKGNSFTLNTGEIALSSSLMKRNHLQVGDTLQYTEGAIQKKFTIKIEMKDAAFGNDMVGMSRFIVSKQDFETLQNRSTCLGLYYVDTHDQNAFNKKLDAKEYSTVINVVSKETYRLVYSFDMIMAALLILVGVCLILIALLVLRFTLTFTMEEQYQEIGILKAIGLRNFNIKKLYLIKYFVIVSAGALLGLCCSIPISNFMIQSVSENMIMANSQVNIGINGICALFVIIVVIVFCYFCTHRLNRVSAITAIHGGESGERFKKHKGLRLHQHLRMRVSIFLGCNDIVAHLRRYMVLIITFCISFILITIPLNTLNTMSSDEMVNKFLLDPDSSVFVRQIESKEEGRYDNRKDFEKGLQRLQQELKTNGYDAKLTGEVLYFLKFQREDKSYRKLMTIQVVGNHKKFLTYSKGTAPKLENEIAISQTVLEQEGWSIGDYINVAINQEHKRMLITGTYSDYMQLGESVRLNSKIATDKEMMFDYWNVMVDMDSTKTQKELAKELKKVMPTYEWSDAQRLVDQNVGGIQDILGEILLPMTAMLCLIIMLITLLMEKLFIAREKNEIAMMKSVGFRYRSIANWQVARMAMVVLTSMIISIPLSFISNHFVLKPIFAIMGAEVNIQVDMLQVYFIYPGILCIGIMIAALLAVRGIKKIDIRDMTNLE